MGKTYIQKAKDRATEMLTSPLCGNSKESKSVDKAIEYVNGLSFYPTETKQIRFWKRVLKELESFK